MSYYQVNRYVPHVETRRIHMSSLQNKVIAEVVLTMPSRSAILDVIRSSNIPLVLAGFLIPTGPESDRIISSLRFFHHRPRAFETSMRSYSHTILDLGDVISSAEFEESVIDLQSSTPSRYGIDNKQYGDLKTKIEIPADFEELNLTGDHNQGLRLVCIICTDHTFQGRSIGSMPSYDTLLVREPGSEGATVPTHRNIFYYNDPRYRFKGQEDPRRQRNEDLGERGYGAVRGQYLQQYSGPAQYYSPDETGYTGWRGVSGAEFIGDGLIDGPKLDVRRVQNYKITFDSLAAYSLQANVSTPDNQTAPGPLPLSTIRDGRTHSAIYKSELEMKRNMFKHFSDYSTKRPGIINHAAAHTDHINLVTGPRSPSGVPLEESHYGCAIGINFFDLVKYSSRLGYLLEFHENRNNKDFTTSALYNSNILNMRIFRRRMSNQATQANSQGSLSHTRYEEYEPDVEIVSSGDGPRLQLIRRDNWSDNYERLLRHRLHEKESEKGSIQEFELVPCKIAPDGSLIAQESREYNREFIIRDYDLFHNVNYGKYTYVLEIKIEDGIYHMVSDLHSSVKASLIDLERLLQKGSIPVDPSTRIGVSSQYDSGFGNYDFVNEKFRQSFSDDPENQQVIDRAIMSYERARKLLTGNILSPTFHLNITTKLSLSVCKIQDLLEFCTMLKEANNSVESILSHGVDLSKNPQRNTEEVSVKNSTGGLRNIIEITCKTGVLVDAFSSTDLFADYNQDPRVRPEPPIFIPSTDWEQIFAQRALAMARSAYDMNITQNNERVLTVLPSQFGRINTIPYSVLTPTPEVQGSPLHRSLLHPGLPKVEIISNFRDFSNLGPTRRSNENTRLDFLTFSRENSRAFGRMDDRFYFPATQAYHSGITLGLSGRVLVPLTDNPSDYELFDEIEVQEDLKLSKEQKKMICAAALRAENRDVFLQQVDLSFQEIVDARRILGPIYDMVHRMSMLHNLHLKNRGTISIEQVFKGQAASTTTAGSYGSQTGQITTFAAEDDIPENIYEKHGRSIMYLGEDGQFHPVQVAKINLSEKLNSSPSSGKRYALIKLGNQEYKTEATIVNNTMFVEV